jgi:sugar lactone lactonase YvrE
MAKVACVLESGCSLGEGPCWSRREGALYWTDVPAKRIHRWSPATGGHRTWPMPEMVTVIAPRTRGGLILASQSGIDFFDPESGKLERFAAPEADKPRNRSNDGKCDRQGRFWYGTMMNNFGPDGSEVPITDRTGGLYRIDPDGTVTQCERGIGISNTLAWSPDNRTMYFGDTLEAIYAYDFDPAKGTIANRRVFARTEQYGYGDGSTIDAEGYLWNARWDGGCIIRWSPDGAIDRIVEIPCRRVTSAVFGGPNLETLYVTTVRYGLSDTELAQQPFSGGIFAIETGVRGLPDGEFAG